MRKREQVSEEGEKRETNGLVKLKTGVGRAKLRKKEKTKGLVGA